MILNVVVEDQVYPVTVPDAIVAEGEAFFSKIDSDMDKGWQMSRDWSIRQTSSSVARSSATRC